MYLGYSQDGSSVDVARCPLDKKTSRLNMQVYDFIGSSYQSSARGEWNTDLDANQLQPQFVSKIENPTTMVLIQSFGGFHRSKFPNWYSKDMNFHNNKDEFPMLFVDGHVEDLEVMTGKGYLNGLDDFQWINN